MYVLFDVCKDSYVHHLCLIKSVVMEHLENYCRLRVAF
jgi:hypothetical protein